MKPMMYSLRALAHLLRYPDATMRAHLGAVRSALHTEAALSPLRLAQLDALIADLQTDGLDAEAGYVEMFDRGRATALHLFEHVHGDSRDRGPAMVDLVQTYEAAGLYLAPDELPDHLTVLLEYASTQPTASARAFLGEFVHLLQSIAAALQRRQSGHEAVLLAVLDLAGHSGKVEAGPEPVEPSLDESWQEPEAFGGCSSDGQAKPGTPQPMKIVRRPPAGGAPSPLPGARP